jgi:sulfatase modifying factor 1
VPGEQGAHPVTRISWFAAAAYCEAQGARLPQWLDDEGNTRV